MKNRVEENGLRLWMEFYRAYNLIFALRRTELEQHGVSLEQSTVLWIINQSDNKATNKDIAQRLFRKRHSVYEMTRRMEKNGLVRKVKDKSASNSEMLALTPKGQKFFQTSREGESVKEVFSVLTEEELQQMRRCLEKLQREAFKHIGQQDVYRF